MKLTCILYAYKSMFPIENYMHKINGLYTETGKIFRFITAYEGRGGGILKHILTHLYSTKCNEINISNSDILKYVS